MRYLKTLQNEIAGGRPFLIAFLNFPKAIGSLLHSEEPRSEHESRDAPNKMYMEGVESNCSSEDVHDTRSLIVDNVSNQMIDVYLEPLQLNGRDAIARQHQYFAAVSNVEWPDTDPGKMEQYVKSLLVSIPGRANGDDFSSWSLRLMNPALCNEELVAIRSSAKSLSESIALLEATQLPAFVVTFSEQSSISPALTTPSSQRA